MKIPEIETFIKIDSDTEECITQIGNILADEYHIYTENSDIIKKRGRSLFFYF